MEKVKYVVNESSVDYDCSGVVIKSYGATPVTKEQQAILEKDFMFTSLVKNNMLSISEENPNEKDDDAKTLLVEKNKEIADLKAKIAEFQLQLDKLGATKEAGEDGSSVTLGEDNGELQD